MGSMNIYGAEEACQVITSSQLATNQELRVEIRSVGLASVQVSAEDSAFGDFGILNGVLAWPANSFEPATYNLRYRGVKANGQIVACEPSYQAIKVTAPIVIPPSPGTSYPNFLPIVSQSGTSVNFKSSQNPQMLPNMTVDRVELKVLDYQAMSNLHGTLEQMKFFLPPGTIGFDANFYHYLAYQDGKGVLKLHKPSTLNIESIPPTNSAPQNVFARLSNGEDVIFYTAGAPANFLLLSSTDSIGVPLQAGGYVYSNFRHPGGQFQRSLWKIYVRKDCYERWFNNPNTKWDVNGNPAEGVSHTCN